MKAPARSPLHQEIEALAQDYNRRLGRVLKLMHESQSKGTRDRASRVTKVRGYFKHRIKMGGYDQALDALSEIITFLGYTADSDSAEDEVKELAADAMYQGMALRGEVRRLLGEQQ